MVLGWFLWGGVFGQSFFENPSSSLLLFLRFIVVSIGDSSDGLFLVFLGDLGAGVET